MPTDRSLISLADLVRRAQAIVDPQGEDDAVSELVTRHEDADEPVRGQLNGLDERLLWGADEDPPIAMAQALVLYLAPRGEGVDDEPDRLLRLAARAELDDPPDPRIVQWLSERGVQL